MEEENVSPEIVYYTLTSCFLKTLISDEDHGTQQLEAINGALSLSLMPDSDFWSNKGIYSLEFCVKQIEHAEKISEQNLKDQKDVRELATKSLIPATESGGRIEQANTEPSVVDKGPDYIEQLECLLDNLKDRRRDLKEIILKLQ